MNVERITELPDLRQRDADSHKGTYGRLLIIAGGRGMAGAAALTGMSALRSGAGLVYLAVPDEVAAIVSGFEPSYLVTGLPSDDMGLLATSPANDPLRYQLANKDAYAVGPGLGQSAAVERLVTQLYRTLPGPAVFDADALDALSRSPQSYSHRGAGRILTPHPGEFARLLGSDTAKVQSNREELAVEFANRNGVILLLKGHETIITDGKRLAINSTGNAGMATGGTGDVLTGVIASLLAQGVSPFDAAQLGAHIHGVAGDLAAAEYSQHGLIASDLPRFVGKALAAFEGGA